MPAEGRQPFAVPLTSGQLGLLYESQLSGKPALNLLQIVVRFDADCPDPGVLAQAWADLAARHDVLRMTLEPLAAEGPRLRLWPAVTPDLQVEDWRATGRDRHEGALSAWLEADRRRGLDTDRLPGWRVALIRLDDRRGAMVWTFHHALLDGNGYRLLLHDLFDCLSARRAGQAPAPRPQGPGFADHCAAVAALDHGPALAFFADHLAGFDTPNRLDPAFQGLAGGDPQQRLTHSRRLDPALSAALRARAAQAGATLANLVALAWGVVLARCSGQEEAVFGVTRSGRYLLDGGEGIAGCQINTLPLRLRLGGATLDSLLAGLRRVTLDTRRFEHVPLTAIAARCDLPPGTALFDSILMFDRGSLPEQMRAGGGARENRRVEELSQMATPLLLAAHDDPALLLRLEHDPARVSPDGAQRLLDYLVRLLGAMAGAGDVPVGRLSMLPPQEEARLLLRAGAGEGAEPRPVIERFEEIVRRQPDAPAVEQIGGGPGLSYAALDARANHLALYLRDLGVGPGSIVGLALPRGPDYVAALLAVLKAQAAFMPLDPGFPAASLEGMIARAGLAALFTRGPDAAQLNTGDLPVLRLDDPALDGTSASPPRRLSRDSGDPAYVIHTSGSSGRPKAVVLPQRALAYHASGVIEAFGLTPADQVLQFASLNFDVSIEEIVPTLLAGALLVLRDEAVAQSVPTLLAALDDHRITVANLPTAFWHVLVAALAEAPQPVALPPSLRLMIVGGERVSGEALMRWQRMYPGLRWLNGYGPTEAAITATLHDAGTQPFSGGEVPIGQPLPHVRAYVAAPDGSLAPDGVTGELWLGGPALASGYLGLPVQTAAAFVADPVVLGGRAYRTGDRVAWIAGGVLACHGRMDRQVKLRGYRIELAAVEVALGADPAVLAAVVDLDHPGRDQARLMAWVRLAPGVGTVEDLHRRLSLALPRFMLPQIVPVDEFPRRPGGKIDVAALPRPSPARPSPAGAEAPAAAPPPDAATAKVQAIFATLLGQDSVGPDDSFFDLGGHSLLSVRLMALLERDFGRRLPLATLFQTPTPRRIAAELARERDSVPNCLVPIQPQGALPPLYAIHILGEQGAFFRPLGALLVPDQPLHGLTLDLLDDAAPTTLSEIAAIYRANIDRHCPAGPVQLIAVSQGAYIAFELAQQLRAAGREVATIFMLDAEGPGGRPMRAQRRSLWQSIRHLTLNLRHVIRRRAMMVRHESAFQVERLRLNLARRGWARGLARPRASVAAHQAAIDLAISAYVAQPYDGAIIVFRATEDGFDTPEGIADALGWRAVAPGRVRLIDTGGTHLSMLQEPHVRELAAHLRPLMAPLHPRARRIG